jgi:hypothetical protein
MATLTFDTLAYFNKLKDAGFTEQQAKVTAEIQRESIEIVVAELETRHLHDMATKRDIGIVQKDIELIRKDIYEMRSQNDVKLAELKADLIRWVVGAGFLQTAFITALLLRLIK